MLLKRNVFRIVCALFYLPVALLSMFEIINLVMTNSQNRYFLVGGVVFGVLLFLIAAYFIKQKKWLIIAENSRPISIILETIIRLSLTQCQTYTLRVIQLPQLATA